MKGKGEGGVQGYHGSISAVNFISSLCTDKLTRKRKNEKLTVVNVNTYG